MKARHLWLLGAFAPAFALAQTANVTVNPAAPGRVVSDMLFGANSTIWDPALGSADTLSLLSAANLRGLRLPGGSLSDEYHWRINKTRDNTWSWASGFNVSATLATNLGAAPTTMITVNYGSGTPEEAAAWVAYANFATTGGSDVALGVDNPAPGAGSLPAYDWQTARTWANLRAAAPLGTDDGMNFLRAGRAQPYGFKYWEIGNENYGSWEFDLQSPQWSPLTYANRAATYMTKMRAVDPTIRIGVVVVKSGEYGNWTQVVLGQLNTLGVRPDFVIYHRYEGGPGAENDATLLQSAGTWQGDADNLRALVNAAFGANAPGIEIIVTENNSVYTNPGKQSTNLVNGLFLADSIANVMKTEITGFFWWDIRNGPSSANNNAASLYGWRNFGDYGILSSVPSPTFPGAPQGTTDTYPTYHAFKLLSYFAHYGDAVIPATSSSNLLPVYAVKLASGGQALLVINKDPVNAITANVTIAGATETSATVYTYGKANDEAAKPETLGCSEITAATSTVTAAAFSHSFPSYSMNVVRFGPAPPAPSTWPAIITLPVARTVTAGANASFTGAANGCPVANYQWQRAPAGSPTYTDIADGGSYSGATTGTLTVSATTVAMSGDQFRLVASTTRGSVSSSGVALTVNAVVTPPPPPPPNPPSGGGGGGRFDLAALAALLALLCGRLARRNSA